MCTSCGCCGRQGVALLWYQCRIAGRTSAVSSNAQLRACRGGCQPGGKRLCEPACPAAQCTTTCDKCVHWNRIQVEGGQEAVKAQAQAMSLMLAAYKVGHTEIVAASIL
jgi:hypothetical protein